MSALSSPLVNPSDSEVAIAAARAGATVLQEMYGLPLTHFAKSSTDFATEADLESERAVLATIAAARPEDALIGEESGHSGHAERTWLVDPLCGTINYAAHTPLFSVNVALRIADELTAAAVAVPATGDLYWTDGKGAYARTDEGDVPLKPNPKSVLVDLDLYHDDDTDPLQVVGLLTDAEFMDRFERRSVGTTLTTTWVAAGKRAAFITEGPAYDSVHFAAPIALGRASGCIITDILGGPLTPDSPGLIMASSPGVHEVLVTLTGKHFR